jgi:uncharacterized protein (DUF362 family)
VTAIEHNKEKTATVAIARCDNYRADNVKQAVARVFSLLNIENLISHGDKVLLKPNFIAPKPKETAAQTDPAIILAVAQLVIDMGGKPFIGDSPAWGNIAACIDALELKEPLRKLAVPVRQLDKPHRIKIAGTSMGISTVALEADKIINLPKLKAHQQLIATLAVKNMFGCVSGKKKAFYHFTKGKDQQEFCLMLLELYKTLNPIVTIIDSVVAMEAMGPLRGLPRPLGFILGGIDPISCEAVCCEIINVAQEQLPMIQAAKTIRFGCENLDRINIEGDNYKNFVCRDFQIPPQVSLRFSLAHICRSIGKQIIILAKTRSGKKN